MTRRWRHPCRAMRPVGLRRQLPRRRLRLTRRLRRKRKQWLRLKLSRLPLPPPPLMKKMLNLGGQTSSFYSDKWARLRASQLVKPLRFQR